jgi:hypothetical protein
MYPVTSSLIIRELAFSWHYKFFWSVQVSAYIISLSTLSTVHLCGMVKVWWEVTARFFILRRLLYLVALCSHKMCQFLVMTNWGILQTRRIISRNYTVMSVLSTYHIHLAVTYVNRIIYLVQTCCNIQKSNIWPRYILYSVLKLLVKTNHIFSSLYMVLLPKPQEQRLCVLMGLCTTTMCKMTKMHRWETNPSFFPRVCMWIPIQMILPSNQ